MSRPLNYLILGLLAIASVGFASPSRAGDLQSLSAMITGVDGKVILLPSSTKPSGGGIKIYDNTFDDVEDANVMFISIFATGITDCSDDGIALNCKIDGVNCVPGVGTAGSGNVAAIPPGWVIPLGDEFGDYGDLGDTGLSFRFCAPINSEKSKHEVVLNASSAFGFCDSFMEAVHIYVEASEIRSGEKGGPNNACGTYTTPNPTTSPD